MIIMWDPVPAGAIPSLLASTSTGSAGILDNTATAANVPNVFAPYSRQYMNQYRIIYDKTFAINPNTISGFTTGTGATNGFGSMYVKWKLKKKLFRKVVFDDTMGAGIGSVASNALCVYMFCDNVTGSAPQWNGNVRINFKDV